MRATIRQHGSDEIRRGMLAAAGAAPTTFRKKLQAAARSTARSTRRFAPSSFGPHIHARTSAALTAWVAMDTKAKPHAVPVDQGSRPHVIRPRRRKVLRFVGRGGLVFTRSVNHPGTKAMRFMAKGRDASRAYVGRLMAEGQRELCRLAVRG